MCREKRRTRYGGKSGVSTAAIKLSLSGDLASIARAWHDIGDVQEVGVLKSSRSPTQKYGCWYFPQCYLPYLRACTAGCTVLLSLLSPATAMLLFRTRQIPTRGHVLTTLAVTRRSLRYVHTPISVCFVP